VLVEDVTELAGDGVAAHTVKNPAESKHVVATTRRSEELDLPCLIEVLSICRPSR